MCDTATLAPNALARLGAPQRDAKSRKEPRRGVYSPFSVLPAGEPSKLANRGAPLTDSRLL